jgi:hypothetical protein
VRLHFLAFKLLLSAGILADKIYTTVRVTNGAPVRANYIVIFPDSPSELNDNRFTARQRADSRAVYRYDVRVVAVDAEGLLLLADAVVGVIGKTPVVAGRTCDPVSMVPAVEEGKGRYDSVTDLHYMDMTFEFVSQ